MTKKQKARMLQKKVDECVKKKMGGGGVGGGESMLFGDMAG